MKRNELKEYIEKYFKDQQYADELFPGLKRPDLMRNGLKAELIKLARKETVAKIQAGGEIEVLKDYEAFRGMVEGNLKTDQFDKYDDLLQAHILQIADIRGVGAGNLIFDEDED